MQPELYGRQEIDGFLEIFFYLVMQRDFTLSDRWKHFLAFVTLLENMAYLSSYGTTEEPLKKLMASGASNYFKQMMLSNAKLELDMHVVDKYFAEQPQAASYWLYSLFTRHSFCHPMVVKNLQLLMHRALEYDLYPYGRMCAVYFNATYVDPQNHLRIRERINEVIQKNIISSPIHNCCQGNRVPQIAVISKNWQPANAVRKCIGAYIRGLAEIGELTLIAINDHSKAFPRYFKKVFKIQSHKGFIAYDSIAHNNFNMAIFTDIGLNIESLILANTRVAPLQIAMYGHPVSTASKYIDYFVVGEGSENELTGHHYTEKTIKIKGPGMNAVKPCVGRPTLQEKRNLLSADCVNIFLASSGPKINPHIVAHWKTIVSNASVPIVMHLLPGEAGLQEISALRQLINSLLGMTAVKFYKRLRYERYMEVIMGCDFALGSYPYGDYNRTIDSLWMGTPFVAIQGHCGYQNTGVASLRALGLDELIAFCTEDYITMALRLINNRVLRTKLQRKILSLPIEPMIVENTEYCNDFNSKLKDLLQQRRPEPYT